METQSAVQIVGNALNAANKQGAFTLQESATIFAAFVALSKALEPADPVKAEAEVEAE